MVVFWWAFAGVAFVIFQWWWSYRAARHDRDLHDEARETLPRMESPG